MNVLKGKSYGKIITGEPISNFRVIEEPKFRSFLEPFVFEGEIDINGKECTTQWDKFGRCSNHQTPQYFINPKSVGM